MTKIVFMRRICKNIYPLKLDHVFVQYLNSVVIDKAMHIPILRKSKNHSYDSRTDHATRKKVAQIKSVHNLSDINIH